MFYLTKEKLNKSKIYCFLRKQYIKYIYFFNISIKINKHISILKKLPF